jgi:hypothetical protein
MGIGCQRQAPAILSPGKRLGSIEMSLKILFPNIPEILLCTITLSLFQVPVFLRDLKRKFCVYPTRRTQILDFIT